MTRAKKGKISIQAHRGMLRLSFSRSWFNGKRKYFMLGLPDTPKNREIAKAKASIMESDYIYEKFDFTLNKYRLETAPEDQSVSLLDIFQQYKDFKSNILKPSSMKNLITVLHKLKAMPTTVIKSPKNIRTWLIEHNSQEQARRTLTQLGASYNWAIEQEIVKPPNPFKRFKKFKRLSQAEPDPFTREERDLIIEKFESSKPHFQAFVKFMFLTGCRPSEAAGLVWQNVDLRAKKIIFCEAVVEGKRQKGTKTNSSRTFPINKQLMELLKSLEQSQEQLFTSEKGKTIDLHNFTQRIWKPLLKQLPVKYRGCYHCRHTFITLCIKNGIAIQDIAKWVGNSPEIILKHYAGTLTEEVPEL